jgi:hypothetical protein
MASSKTEICNIAISHLGSAKEIANIETEASQEAGACRRFYETALKATLRDFPWSFATKITDMQLVEEEPNDEWSYSYRYPSDCLRIRRILSGTRIDTNETRESYKISRDSSGLVIFSDKEDAQIEYTLYETDVLIYPEDFVIAFSYRLANLIAPRITSGDKFKLGAQALQYYMAEISRAESSSLNEQQADHHPDSEFIRARNG